MCVAGDSLQSCGAAVGRLKARGNYLGAQIVLIFS